MRAMLLHKPGDANHSPLTLSEVPMPEPGEGQVRVRVSVCGVCRTDLHVVEGDLPLPGLPIVPGHQVVGRVDAIGAGCSQLKPGDRVGIAWLRETDGVCEYCRQGRENLCVSSRYTGYHEDGGYAEFALVPEAFAYPLPDRLDDSHVAPLLCAGIIGYRALNRAALPEGGSLLLVGFGSSAAIVLPIALHRGFRVMVVTRTPSHQAMALDQGALWAGDAFDRIPEKVDSAILFAPSGRLVPPTLEALKPGGTLSIAGIHLTDIPTLIYEKHLFYEKQVTSVTSNTRRDGRDLLNEANAIGLTPRVRLYDLADANRALQDVKHSRVDGTAVLTMS
ncbi:MAG: zinc-binding alcohol dehydrogenase family protein [Phycisphaeraceae bacterium]